MYWPFLLFFIVVPLLELALLIQVGSQIGILATIGLVIATAVIGTTILQRQGLAAFRQMQDQMQSAQVPMTPVVDGVFLMVAGAFLLTPGLLTDAAGFTLLVPPVRRWIAKTLLRKAMASKNIDIKVHRRGGGADQARPQDASGRSGPQSRGGASGLGPATGSGAGEVIDGEFERLDETTINPNRKRP